MAASEARSDEANRSRAGTAGPNPNWALLAAVLGSSMIFTDGTAVNVALPVLQRDLQASAASVQWVVEGYALFLSALLLIGGSLGDVFGRRRTYGLGIAIFTLASIACAAAPNIELLIAARCLQGVGGALATPGSLALISASFSGAARGRAIGTWSAFSIIVSAAGPVLGGWLVQTFSWRWIFTLNLLPAAIVLIILALRVAESRDPSASRRVDIPGAALATAGLGALIFGLIRLEGTAHDAFGVACAGGGMLLLLAFVTVERRAPAPMLQLALFSSRPFSIANVYTLLLYAALGGSLYFVPFDLIDVQGYKPAAAGAALLPTTFILFALSRYAGGLVDRLGPRPLLAWGALSAAAGFAMFATAGVGRPYWLAILPATLLLGLGAAGFVAPLTTLVMGAVPVTHAGVASGINNAASRVAGLFAIALLGVVQTIVVANAVERGLARAPVTAATRAIVERQRDRIVSGAAAQGIADPLQRAFVQRTIRTAYARGFAVVMLGAALLAVLAACLAFDPSLRKNKLRP
jgi:EmrB/QacA subfamily drug resistance transporter